MTGEGNGGALMSSNCVFVNLLLENRTRGINETGAQPAPIAELWQLPKEEVGDHS